MRMYGDFVNGLCYSIAIPFYLWLWHHDPSPGARDVTISFIWTSIFSWLSWWYDNAILSTVACIGNSSTMAIMNLHQWPHAGEIVVIPQFLWAILIASGNTSLTFACKASMVLIALAAALLVEIKSPLVEATDNLPFLLGATAVHLLFHYSTNKGNLKQEIISAHGASLVLAGTFAYHMTSEFIDMIHTPGYAKEGGFSILRAAFFALVGLAAAGAFRREINLKESLEVLVEQRAQELSAQADRLRVVEHALQASETAIAITDSSQLILWSNSALESLIAMDNASVHGTHLLKLLGVTYSETPSNDENKDCICKWFNEASTTQNDMCFHGLDLQIEISPFPNDSKTKAGQASGSRFLVVLKDVTAQRERDRAEKAAVREAMAAQAMQESMQTLSHELRTPLQGIMGMMSLMLEDGTVPNSLIDSMNVVMTSSRLLLTLINNMLDVRKCDSEMMDKFQLNPLNLSGALSTAVDFCRPFAEISEVGLLANFEDDLKLVHVKSNPLRFQQVMINLVSNSIKHSTKGSKVSITMRVLSLDEAEAEISTAVAKGECCEETNLHETSRHKPEKVAVVSVSDTGTGIPEKEHDKIFGRFTQLDTKPNNVIGGSATAQPSGTGLGLNLCLKFVQRMNGKIWANNNQVCGSTFSFYLPMVEQAKNAKTPLLQELEPPQSPTAVTQSTGTQEYHVLVVDDTIINLKVLNRMLRKVGVGKVTCVGSGKEALEELEKEVYNLVITDLQMPEMSGTELTELIVSGNEGRLHYKPIVVGLTAEVSESLQTECLSIGMTEVLYKPITASQMHEFLDRTADKITVIAPSQKITEHFSPLPPSVMSHMQNDAIVSNISCIQLSTVA